MCLVLKVLILLLIVIEKILFIVFLTKRIEFTSISRRGGVFVFVNVEKKNKLKIFRNGNLINPNTSWKLFIYLRGAGGGD